MQWLDQFIAYEHTFEYLSHEHRNSTAIDLGVQTEYISDNFLRVCNVNLFYKLYYFKTILITHINDVMGYFILFYL